MLNKFGLIESNQKSVNVGDVFKLLTVVAVGRSEKPIRYYAVCQCLCGSELKKIRVDHLKSNNVISCGCEHKRISTTHGGTKYGHGNRWSNMMARCYDSKNQAYKNYGGRGITVCDRWHNVANYVNDIKDGYFLGAELDRIKNDEGYSPENTKWSTRKENCNNRKSCVITEVDGITSSITDHAERLGISPSLVLNRINVLGWRVEAALKTPVADIKENALKAVKARWSGHVKKTSPPKKILKTVSYQGKTYNIKQLSELCGVSVKLLNKRIYERNWTVERAVINESFKGNNKPTV